MSSSESSESSEASSYEDASNNDQETSPEKGPKRVVKTFSSRLLSELIDFTLRSLGSLPCSIVFVVLVFMIDTALRSSSAKLYFVCGYFIQLVFFYTFSVITFPKSATTGTGSGQEEGNDDENEGSDFNEEEESEATSESAETKRMHDYLLQMVPFQQNTTASFYNFSVGYLLGYWGNINIQKNTRNATLVNSYYAASVFFSFTFSVFYLKSCLAVGHGERCVRHCGRHGVVAGGDAAHPPGRCVRRQAVDGRRGTAGPWQWRVCSQWRIAPRCHGMRWQERRHGVSRLPHWWVKQEVRMLQIKMSTGTS